MPVSRTTAILGGVVASGIGAMAPSPAWALPFGFASNQITNFTAALPPDGAAAPATPTASVSGTAAFGGFPSASFAASSALAAPLAPPQVFSGPGPAPPPNFVAPPASAIPPTGTRALASIGGGGTPSAGATINDAAGGFGAITGSGASNSSVTTQVQVLGAGQAVQVTFNDLIQLVASTSSLAGETSTSTIQNVFSITDSTTLSLLDSFAPADLNQQITSVAGSPARNTVGPLLLSENYVSPILSPGVLYTLSFTSSAGEVIQGVGSAQVPEPASLAVLGATLCGLLVRRRAEVDV